MYWDYWNWFIKTMQRLTRAIYLYPIPNFQPSEVSLSQIGLPPAVVFHVEDLIAHHIFLVAVCRGHMVSFSFPICINTQTADSWLQPVHTFATCSIMFHPTSPILLISGMPCRFFCVVPGFQGMIPKDPFHANLVTRPTSLMVPCDTLIRRVNSVSHKAIPITKNITDLRVSGCLQLRFIAIQDLFYEGHQNRKKNWELQIRRDLQSRNCCRKLVFIVEKMMFHHFWWPWIGWTNQYHIVSHHIRSFSTKFPW